MNPLLVWGIIPALLVARELLRVHRVRSLRRELRRLRWRDKFAQIRDETVRLITRDELSPTSLSAQTLYLGSSVFVRHANDYDGFAQSVLLHLLADNMPDEDRAKRLAQELQGSPKSVQHLTVDYFTCMIALACERSWFVRLLVKNYGRKHQVSRRPRLAHLRDKLAWFRENAIYRELSDGRTIAYRSRTLKDLGAAHC